MSKVTMERNGPMQNGASRIPRFDHSNKNSNAFNHQQPLPNVGTSQKPSKLQQMQKDYQLNLLKEKEEKIVSMYEDSQKRALNKVNQNKGLVRDFFNERRAGSGSSNNSTTPTMEHLYQQRKLQNQFGPPNGYSRNKPVSKYPSYNKNNFNGQKPSAGIDRANPLAPIQRNNEEPENPFAKRKPQIVRPRTYKGVQATKTYSEDMKVPRSAPNGVHNNFHSDENLVDYNEEDSPLPSTRRFQHLQQKRRMLQDQRISNKARSQLKSSHSTRKPENRRNGPYEYETSEEDEGYAEANETGSTDGEMKKKQKELLAQIEAQQKELDKLRNERMNAEIQEKKEVERRKKLEEERRKKRIEEERRRQVEEEEERVREQLEEEKQHKLAMEKQQKLAMEKQQKLAMEKQRMRHISQNSYDNDDNYGNNYYERQASPEQQYYVEKKPSPAPPANPRPTNTRKAMPKKQPPKRRSPSPLPTGDHTALYENADHLDGAYENVGRLKACYNCGRKFAEDRLGKHEKSCKNITKKRKVLDPSKLRTRGTELEQYSGHRQPTPTKVKKNNWRAKHESFQQAIKYAKKVSQIEKEGGDIAALPPPPPSENPDYVQCPHCSRKFNESAANRHIPHCKNTKARAKPPPQRRR